MKQNTQQRIIKANLYTHIQHTRAKPRDNLIKLDVRN